MKKICVGMVLLIFVLFSYSCATSQQGKIQTSTNREDGKAEYELGEKYFEGKGVPQDYTKAAEWFRKAAEIGNPNAQYKLGRMYQTSGRGVPFDIKEAFKWYHMAAERGLVEAQYHLGGMYRFGIGVPQDYAEALKWYRKVAEHGFAAAQFYLGLMYYNGEGVPKDYTKAAEWYRKAAEQGVADAQFNLGNMYYSGQGVTQDYPKAVKWYLKAAEQGLANAQLSLGWMYSEGKGVNQDYAEAVKWYRKAAKQGYALAQDELGFMYYLGIGVSQNYTEAAKWYLKAAEQGLADAQGSLGGMYNDGKGVPQDYVEAAKWYLKAAEQGLANAQLSLGWMYSEGKGVNQDYAEAAAWYRKAAKQGNADARLALGKLLEKTDYPGWECLRTFDNSYFFINKSKIKRQGNLVWFWTMRVFLQELDSGKKSTKLMDYKVADCDSARLGLVSCIKYDSNGNVAYSHSFKESEIDMEPVVPGSIGEDLLEYACSHSKAGTYKKGENTKAGACFGTGWPVASGFVVTNNHVVEGRNHITLIRPDGVKIPASVAAHDAFNDLALLKVEDTGLLPAALPLSSKPAVLGEKVITIGYPHPDLLGVKPKLTEGVINSTSGLGDDPRALQISVPIQGGNSGGPLVNMEGKVVGIITSKIDAVKMFKWTGDLPQNINYSIKISYLKGLLSSVPQKQHIDTLAPFKYTSVQELAKEIKNSVLMIMAN